MKKIFRWAGILLGCLLVFLGIVSGLAWYYRPEITQAIRAKLHEQINGDADFQAISISIFDDFPNVSITLREIYLRGPSYAMYHRDVFNAKKVQLHVSLRKLLVKEVEVSAVKIIHGEFFIFRTRGGYTNLDVFKPTRPASKDTVVAGSSGRFSVREIQLEDMKVAYQDSLKEKSFGVRFVRGKERMIRTDSSQQFQYDGRIDFDGLGFNLFKGSYLLGKSADVKLHCEYTPGRHELTLHPSVLKFDKSLLGLSGGFNLTPQGKFSLNFNSADLNYSEGLALLPQSLQNKLAKYNIDAPFSIGVQVAGTLAPGNQPAVDVQFKTKDATISIGNYHAQRVSLNGFFTNHRENDKEFDDHNSVVGISSFVGTFNWLPMKGQATFIDLVDPFAQLKISVDADAKTLQRELDSTRYQLGGGTLHTTLSYEGKLKEYLDPNKSRFDGKLTGRTVLKNVKFVWVAHNVSLDAFNASVAFTQSQFLIENLSFRYNKNPVSITGSVVGFVPFFSVPQQKGIIKLHVSSTNLNFTPTVSTSVKYSTRKTKAREMKLISDLIDKIYSKLEFELMVNIDQFQYRSFKAREMSGTITLSNNQLLGKPIKMKLAGGDVLVTFGFTDLQKQINPLWIQASVQDADVKEFFYCFNNFNQQGISYQNLSGKLNAKIRLNTQLDDDLNILMKSLRGKVELSVKKGKLTDFVPLEKLSNFLFKNRDFANVEFAEINSNFALRGTELTIGRMEVQSSVLSLFLEGRYSLADSTDLSIQLPLSNLKARDKTYIPKNVGVGSSVGPSIFLRARKDEKGAMAIAYDPFKKFRKK